MRPRFLAVTRGHRCFSLLVIGSGCGWRLMNATIMERLDRIMPDKVEIVRERQLAIRREMINRRISLDVVAIDSKISPSSVAGYFPNPDSKALPLDLMSLLLPEGYAIVPKPEHIDHDALMAACVDFVATYGAARHPDSEDGIAIGLREAAKLDGAAGHVRAVVA